MLRALSTRNGRGRGYEKLKEEYYEGSAAALLGDAKLTRANTVPAPASSKLRDLAAPPPSREAKSVEKKAKKVSKIHPIFNLFHPRLRKKATAKPEFSRYLEYLKEGGMYVTPTTPTN